MPQVMRAFLRLLPLLLGGAALCIGVAFIGNFIEDDTLISLRYAERFLEGKGLTWNDGERVEGYSNLSWTVGCALLHFLGVPWTWAPRILSGISYSLILLSFGWLLESKELRRFWLLPLPFALLFGLSGTSWVWLLGGLEEPALAACAALAALALTRVASQPDFAGRLLAGSFCFAVLTRPDAPLVVAPFALVATYQTYRLHGLSKAKRIFLLSALLPFLVFFLHALIRHAYYGQWVPNTALVKAQSDPALRVLGAKYLLGAFRLNAPLYAVALPLAFLGLAHARARMLSLASLTTCALFFIYLHRIGGDFFPAYRRTLVAQTLLLLSATWAVSCIGSSGLSRLRTPRLVWLSWLLPAGLLLGVGWLALPWVNATKKNWEVGVTKIARWQWDGQPVGEGLRAAFGEKDPLFAVTAAGALPFFSQLRSLDLLGLNDAHIARSTPDRRLPLAHQHGDGAYVLRRAPDLILFGTPTGKPPHFKSGDEMARTREFKQNYLPRDFQFLSPHVVASLLYVRKTGVLGVESSERSLRIPAYLFEGHNRAVLIGSNQMGSEFWDHATQRFSTQSLPAGSYRLRVVPAAPGLKVDVRTGRRRWLRANATPGEFSLLRESPLQIELNPRDGNVNIQEVVIERLQAAPPEENPKKSPDSETDKRPGAKQSKITLFRPQSQQRPQSRYLLVPDQNAPSGQAHDYSLQGASLESLQDRAPRRGQGKIEGDTRDLLNTFLPHLSTLHPKSGDEARLSLCGPRVQVPAFSQLEFRIAGGALKEIVKQQGLFIYSGDELLAAYGGLDDERLRTVRIDLTALAGTEIQVCLRDDSHFNWGHILVSNPRLLSPN